MCRSHSHHWTFTTKRTACILWIVVLLNNASAAIPSFRTLQFTAQPNDTVVLAGQSALLSCGALYEGGQPSIYSWERNGELLSFFGSGGQMTRYTLANGSLFFSGVRDSGPFPDPGNYRCIAEVTEGVRVHRISTPTARLQLSSLGDFVASPNDLVLMAGETAMFRCELEAIPRATYTWTKNNLLLSSSSRVVQHASGSVLEIRTVNSTDAGQYRCKARSLSGEKLGRSATLTVMAPTARMAGNAPGFVLKPWDTSAVEGSSVMLFCAVNGTDSDGNLPTITWLRQGSTLNTSAGNHLRIVGSGSLQIEQVTTSDQGVYTCRGENLEDVADAQATLTVHVAPYFVTRPANTYGQVNGNVELLCDIRGSPEPRVYWLKDSDAFEPSEFFKMVGRNLRIMGLMKTDAGYFQCVGENEIGRTHTIAQLIVLDEDVVPLMDNDSVSSTVQSILPVDSSLPSAPVDLRALVSQTYVTLTWASPLRPGEAPVLAYTVSTMPVTGAIRLRAVNTTSTDYTVEGLLPNTEYIFQVIAYNRNGRSLRHSELKVKTSEEIAVPGVVSNMKTCCLTHNSIRVTWDLPQQTNGEITEYRVYYYTNDQTKESYKATVVLNALLDGLQPYTEYHVRVVAINRNGPGSPTEERSVRTYSAKPSAPPANVSVEVSGTTSLLLRWAPPPDQNANGQLTGYKIRYKPKLGSDGVAPMAHTTDADGRTYEIRGLQPATEYLVRLAAININGTGDYSSWIEARTYSVDLDESRPPGKPLYVQTKTFSREMIVSWAPPSENVQIRGYKLGYGRISPDERWVDSIPMSTRFYTLENLEPQSNYVVQIIAFNKAGDSLPALQQDFTREEGAQTPTSELMPPLEVRVTVISAYSAVVTWYDNTLGQNQKVTDDRVYTVKLNALSGSTQRKTRFLNCTDLFARVDGLKPYTKYEFSVMTTKGNRVSIYSLSARNTTFEAVPSTSPQDLTISTDTKRQGFLLISWQPPSRPNGRIIRYTIYSNTNNQQPLESWIVEEVQGHVLNHPFGPVTPATVYYFRIAAHNSKGASPPSSTVIIKSANTDGTGGFNLYPELLDAGGYLDEGTGSLQEVSGRPMPKPDLLDADTDVTTQASGLPSTHTLWIIIACVAGITTIALAALVGVLCRRRISNNQKKPNLKASNKAPKGVAGCKGPPPDLWIDEVELKMVDKQDVHDEPDECSSMLRHNNFDLDRSQACDMSPEDIRYSTLGRSRPVIIAPQPHRDAMPRAAVHPMSVDPSRPLYPRSQFSGVQYGSTPRVHVGDTSQPSSEGYKLHVMASPSGMTPAPESVPPRPPIEGKALPLRSFSLTNTPSSNIPKHIVKPQPQPVVSPFRAPPPIPQQEDTDSLKRPPRPPYANLGPDRLTTSRDDLKTASKMRSTEQLSAEMADIDTIMQNLHAIRHDFDYA